jgi:4-hydroxy-tetrahydrodipicolinate synthase
MDARHEQQTGRTASASPHEWAGVFSVVLTPFTASAAVDIDVFEELVDRTVREGASGIVVAGSTGEFYSLTDDERLLLFETAVRVAGGRIVVIGGANAGNVSTAETIKLVRRSVDSGVDGVMLLPPIFVQPNEDETVRFYDDVARNGAAPILAYNNPRRSGRPLDDRLLGRLVSDGSIVALKDSSTDLSYFTRTAAEHGSRLRLFTGFDSLITPSAAVGGHGVVSMLHQVVGRHVVDTWQAAASGSFGVARELQVPIDRFYTAMYGRESAPYAVLKYAMKKMGRGVGEPRLPVRPATPNDAVLVDELLLAFDGGATPGIR